MSTPVDVAVAWDIQISKTEAPSHLVMDTVRKELLDMARGSVAGLGRVISETIVLHAYEWRATRVSHDMIQGTHIVMMCIDQTR